MEKLSVLELEYDEMVDNQATLQTKLDLALEELKKAVSKIENVKNENDDASMKSKKADVCSQLSVSQNLKEAATLYKQSQVVSGYISELRSVYDSRSEKAKEMKDLLVLWSKKLSDEVNQLKSSAANESMKKRVDEINKIMEKFRTITNFQQGALKAKQKEVDDLATLLQLSIENLSTNIQVKEEENKKEIARLEALIVKLEKAHELANMGNTEIITRLESRIVELEEAQAQPRPQLHDFISLIVSATGSLATAIGAYKMESHGADVWIQFGCHFVTLVSLSDTEEESIRSDKCGVWNLNKKRSMKSRSQISRNY